MKKLQSIIGYAKFTFEKLAGIREDLVRTNYNWQNQEFPKLIEALRKGTDRNPFNNDQ